MAINEMWLPIISTVVAWAKENMGPSKKELKIQVEDLQKQVATLAQGNVAVMDNMSLIIRAILSELRCENQYVINVDQMVYVGSNNGSVSPISNMVNHEEKSIDIQKNPQYYANHFFVTNEEIELSRIKKERRNK